ncbi:Protein UPSTREAM OF FLC [Mucuna pruriens]|uniref:Protein UPSTREAM OF FLC n=1 Tax=Mucuna pruriens TaxID=157652 RepID=A0A371FCP0_MUCPR|nr:Protein UPSTREAM OF FLC [Mucuna pruriens]
MLERETSPEGSKIWIEPKHQATELKVPVIYYLSRNGHLEHPHLMEVPISSPQGVLCVKDVIDRLSFLRGQGMANMYSWSTKRSYKNGFVWQDLSENDFIYPSSGHEYVLKGTQMIETSLSFRSCETISTSSSKSSSGTNDSSTCADTPATIKGRSQSLNSCDYKFYKAKTCEEFAGKATNASTQTEEKHGERIKREKVEECEENDARENEGSLTFSSSSFGSADIRSQRVENERPSGRIKASEVLMQFIRSVEGVFQVREGLGSVTKTSFGNKTCKLVLRSGFTI